MHERMTNDNDDIVSASISGVKSAGKLEHDVSQFVSSTSQSQFTPENDLHSILVDISNPCLLLAQLDIQTVYRESFCWT